jgi:hypothetical protein
MVPLTGSDRFLKIVSKNKKFFIAHRPCLEQFSAQSGANRRGHRRALHLRSILALPLSTLLLWVLMLCAGKSGIRLSIPKNLPAEKNPSSGHYFPIWENKFKRKPEDG